MVQRSDVPGSQRLFILGAGFSKPAGLPLATELLDSVLNEIEHLNGRTHLHRAVDSYLDYAEATTGRRPFQIDIEEFAALLRRPLADAALADRLGAAAHARVLEEYVGDRHLEQYVDLFSALVGAGSPPPARRRG